MLDIPLLFQYTSVFLLLSRAIGFYTEKDAFCPPAAFRTRFSQVYGSKSELAFYTNRLITMQTAKPDTEIMLVVAVHTFRFVTSSILKYFPVIQ